ncbi:hypothetical protein ACA910_010848 [Epithemia clementina (nom. ined.)]
MQNDGRWLSMKQCAIGTVLCVAIGVNTRPACGQRNPTAPPDDAVTAIQLNNLELDGTIPTELAMLEYLSQLILRNNKIHGSIPRRLHMPVGFAYWISPIIT